LRNLLDDSSKADSRDAADCSRQSQNLVLIVDDDLTTLRVLDLMLQGAGLETVCAQNLAAAEQMVNSMAVSLILLDVHLPDGCGPDWCRQLSSRYLPMQVPVLFISSNDDLETKIQGFSAGGLDYITKPLAMPEVLARVRTHLRLRATFESLTRLQQERIGRLAVSQQMLMPQPEALPEACFEVCLKQVLDAGGDFYDVITSGNRITDYIVADASGHDLGVSLWTASFKTLLMEYASVLYTPQDICSMLNASLRRTLPNGAYFSAVYARLQRGSGRLTLVSAGHPSAILVSGGKAAELYQEGDLIGLYPDPLFGVLEMRVQPGDRLYLYSDGLIENSGGRRAGLDRLCDACEQAAGLPLKETVRRTVEQVCSAGRPEDDIVLLGISI
jgi:phosphoserine phosphatase RsbU/P